MTNFEVHSVSSGNFTVPGLNPQDPSSPGLDINRTGIDSLVGPGVFTKWEDVFFIKVDNTKAEWILKDPEPCVCNANSRAYNASCVICNKWGTKAGLVISKDHPNGDTNCVNFYEDLDGLLRFWARQSNKKVNLPDGTPVYNLDIPRIIFKVPTLKDNASPERFAQAGASIERNFAYHDEYRMEMLKVQLKNSGASHILETLPSSTIGTKEKTYGRFDSIFS